MNGAMRRYLGVLVVVGCHGADNSINPDAPPDTSPPGEMGLNVLFASSPSTFPGVVDDSRQLSITSAHLRPALLSLVGDASPGDKTTEVTFDLVWDPTTAPDPLHFPDAPSGIYSNMLVEIDGLFIEYAYEVKGSVNVGGTQHNFYIHDRDRFDVSIDSLDVELDAGSSANVTLTVDFIDALKSIDYTKLSGDPLDLDTDDQQTDQVRDKLKHGFTVNGHGSGPDG